MFKTKAAIAEKIVALMGAKATGIKQIIGLGAVNQVFVVETNLGNWVVRFHIDPLETDDYLKEEWCLRAAAEVGIPVPQFIARGATDGTNYIVQSFVEGDHGDVSRSPTLWKKLGEYARKISEISIESAPDSLFPRFGRDPATNWHRHVEYNLAELNPTDLLLKLGVYEVKDQERIRALLSPLKDKISYFGLSHGDVVPKNVIVPRNGDPVLIDWGSAFVNPSPFDAILRIQRDEAGEGFSLSDVECFAEGYGVALAPLQPTLQALWLLNRIDVVRWAIDNRPDRLSETVERAKVAMDLVI